MKIELVEKCKECKGTGVYIGLAEREGFGVVCNHCGGTGKFKFIYEYEEFDGRGMADVHTIVETNPGIVMGGELDFGGMPYADWLAGKKFTQGMEMRNFTCPAWWYQSANYSKKPEWEECIFCGRFSECANFTTKEECWKRFDAENE